MSPRPRKKKNAALPPNLYPANGGKSYRYRHPGTGKYHGMGSDKANAIAAAKELNSLLMVANDLVTNVLGSETLDKHITWFYENILPEREYKLKTLEMYNSQVKKLRAAVGAMPVEDVTVQDLAELMEKQTPRVANQVRQVAVDIFKVAVSRGLRHDNPAEATLKRRAKKERSRLTKGQFDAIRARCEPWMQNAMDLALITLQRRNDVAHFKFDEAKDGKLYVIQEKTEKYDTGYLAIAIGQQLEAVIKRCRDDTASPYMVHRRPQRKVKDRDGMDHWTQVKPEMLTRAFAKARDKSGLFEGMDSGSLPSFHEIRALGIKLYRDQGADPQKLAGHASERMTANYDAGHDEIRWVEAVADLKI